MTGFGCIYIEQIRVEGTQGRVLTDVYRKGRRPILTGPEDGVNRMEWEQRFIQTCRYKGWCKQCELESRGSKNR